MMRMRSRRAPPQLEIPALQLLGACFMGNKPLLKPDSKARAAARHGTARCVRNCASIASHPPPQVSVVAEQFLRLLHACGMPAVDADLLHTDGPTCEALLLASQPRSTLFTGSKRVAERLARALAGRVRIEDAGLDWKLLGPDVPTEAGAYVAWVCDQDAFAASGQKCSAQSLLFVHAPTWGARRARGSRGAMEPALGALAARRGLADLSAGPVLTWSNARLAAHLEALLALPGAALAFGGQPLATARAAAAAGRDDDEADAGSAAAARAAAARIPPCYGAFQPTAVYVPLRTLLEDARAWELASTEVFGPLQICTEYVDAELDDVIALCNRLEERLTAAVVSNDPVFTARVLGGTSNGTTYVGLRARTTGAPANHFFGPGGDPRAAGIGTPDAVRAAWSGHREVVTDVGPLPPSWHAPPPT
jgi:1-pyrroline-5-carboxylate dehydrogenase